MWTYLIFLALNVVFTGLTMDALCVLRLWLFLCLTY